MNNGEEPDYKKLAQFWQMKYFELLGHSNSVIAALARPQVLAAQAQARAQMDAAQAAQ